MKQGGLSLRRASGFSLIEVLVALSILALVGIAVVGLSNSIGQGTIIAADKTVTNWLASEGSQQLEGLIANNPLGGPWLTAATGDNGSNYGWYKLTKDPTGSLLLTKVPNLQVGATPRVDFFAGAEKVTVGNLVAGQLICIEAVSAAASTVPDNINCNVNSNGAIIEDGLRTTVTSTPVTQEQLCQAGDQYCQITLASLNQNRLPNALLSWKSTLPGNAVKIRSVVVWQDKERIRSSELTTLMTNWREGR